ncbi:MAG: O-antigen ligase family protein [Odoribacter sp.]
MIEAFFIFLPTTIFGYMQFFIIAAIYMFFKNRSIVKSKLLIILLLIIGLSLFNFVFSINNINSEYSISVLSTFPYALLFIPTYIIASNLNEKILKYLLIFISIEIVIGFLEYSVGVISFFDVGQTLSDLNVDATLLYDKRVFGLSSNSSALAVKILLGIMIAHKIRSHLTYPFFLFFFLLCLIGFYITFNRTAILSFILFLFLFYFEEIKIRLKNWKYIIGIATTMIILGGLVVHYWEDVVIQFTRGDGSGDSSILMGARQDIYSTYISYISEHFLGGNGSSKYCISLGGHVFHAHNSFLMTLAANGVPIAILYFSILFLNLKKYNTFLYIVVVIFYSFLQYGIFWGISFMDIFLFYIIISSECKQTG